MPQVAFAVFRSRIAGVMLAAVAAIGLGGCATAPTDPAAKAEFEDENDPLEPVNRVVFEFNEVVDGLLLRPAAVVYREALPRPVQRGVNNFLNNLRSPVVLANDLLQGEMGRAGDTASRFVINTTIGVLGVWDAASRMGIHGHSEDFGQTFAIWGVGEGFYLVLPFLGPSNPRDAAGLALEWYVDPFNVWAREEEVEGFTFARSVTTAVDFRARNLETLDELKRTSLDYYIAIRTLYRQRRDQEIRNGKPGSEMPAPTIFSGGPGEVSSKSAPLQTF